MLALEVVPLPVRHKEPVERWAGSDSDDPLLRGFALPLRLSKQKDLLWKRAHKKFSPHSWSFAEPPDK
jgi:hypothetical protein